MDTTLKERGAVGRKKPPMPLTQVAFYILKLAVSGKPPISARL